MEGNGVHLADGTEHPTDADDGDRPPSRSDVFEVLSHQRRRYALSYLLQQDDFAATKHELSTLIAAWERGEAAGTVTAEQIREVYLDLHRNHLPLMVDRGVVEFDVERDDVHLQEGVDGLEEYLGVSRRERVPWGQVYVMFGLVSGAWAVGAWAGLMPFAALGGHAWAVVVSLAVAGAGVVHTSVEGDGRYGRARPATGREAPSLGSGRD